MHNPQAAFALMQAAGEKVGKLVACFVAVETVQVDFGLDNPTATAQIAQDVGGDANAQVVRLISAL